MQTFYQLLSVDAAASPEDIKRAFRQEIARYHPDKVHHLGKEFQEMAATRAAQLTEAYRTLMDADLRADYDGGLRSAGVDIGAPSPVAPPSASPHASPSAQQPSGSPSAGPAAPASPPTPAGDRASRFSFERATRDEFVRKATLGRLRQALAAEFGTVEEVPMKGFDVCCAVKLKKLFGRGSGPRIVARFVDLVDRAAVQEAWALAQKGDSAGEICVFLMGGRLAPERELAEAIAEQRRKAGRASRAVVSVIPIDVRDWHAYVPNDAPPSCKSLLQRLKNTA